MLSSQVSRFIMLARWAAAFAVLIAHVSNLFINENDIMTAPHGPGAYVWWFFHGFSHEAVVVFFVISGFLVGGSLIEKSRGSQPFLAKYFVDRVARIYIVLVPVLLIGLLLDTLGRQLFGGLGPYELPGFAFGLNVLGWNMLNMQGTFAPTFGTNFPLWSLGFEFWYYVACPLLLLPLLRGAPLIRWGGFGCGVALALTFGISAEFFLLGGGIWAAGAVTRALKRPFVRSKFLALGIFLVVLVAARLIFHDNVKLPAALVAISDSTVALAFCNLLLTLRFAASGEWAVTRWRLHKPLSEFSYSLYACHFPILLFLAACADFIAGIGWRAQAPTALHWIVAFGAIALTLCLSWLLARVTEARTADVRHAMYRLLDRAPSRNVAANVLASEAEPAPATSA
jgi:peptidoglycan/LPS O-acetylase OafA/YrhL